MYLQFVVAVRQRHHVNRIIEIPRRFAVNRHNRQMPEIAAACQVALRHYRLCGSRFALHFVRKNIRQMMLANNDLDVHADVAGPPQNFNHASRRSQAALGKTRQLHVYHRAIQLRISCSAVRGSSTAARSVTRFFLQRRRQLRRPAE